MASKSSKNLRTDTGPETPAVMPEAHEHDHVLTVSAMTPAPDLDAMEPMVFAEAAFEGAGFGIDGGRLPTESLLGYAMGRDRDAVYVDAQTQVWVDGNFLPHERQRTRLAAVGEEAAPYHCERIAAMNLDPRDRAEAYSLVATPNAFANIIAKIAAPLARAADEDIRQRFPEGGLSLVRGGETSTVTRRDDVVERVLRLGKEEIEGHRAGMGNVNTREEALQALGRSLHVSHLDLVHDNAFPAVLEGVRGAGLGDPQRVLDSTAVGAWTNARLERLGLPAAA